METGCLLFKPHTKDLGGFQVSRILPGFPQKMIGPFILFDHLDPVTFPPSQGLDVRPHPHIGLATVTYLFEGRIIHRDSLGTVQSIEPGDVNWMSAGSGIVHSERTAPEDRVSSSRMHGIQTWVALPTQYEQSNPLFAHFSKSTLPVIEFPGATLSLIVGTAFGQRSPVPSVSDIFYVATEMLPGATVDLLPEHEERGIYVSDGDITVNGKPVPPGHLALLPERLVARIHAASSARLMLLGGARIDGERFIWWNFVASSRELMEHGKHLWREQRFGKVPGETEFIPLPTT